MAERFYTLPRKSTPEFRTALKQLKKAGIIDVDISKAQPWWVRTAGPRGGKYTLAEVINKYDDLLSGKQSAVRLPPETLANSRKLGYEEIRGGKVLVPHGATEKVVIRKGKIERIGLDGIRRIEIPCEYHNLEQYLLCLKKNQKNLQAQLGRNHFFAFRFFGGHSHVYQNIDQLIDEFRKYNTVVSAIQHRSSREMNEVYRNFEIVVVTKSAWNKTREAEKAARKHKRKKSQATGNQLDKLKQGPAYKLEQFRKQRAEQQRKYRAKLTGARKEEYLQKARTRAKKAANKRKG